MKKIRLPIMKLNQASIRLIPLFFCAIVNFTHAQDITRYSPNHDSGMPLSDNNVAPVIVSLNIHPNPTAGSVEISFNEGNDEKYMIDVYNNLGCKVLSAVKSAGTKIANIDFSKFQSGLYTIKGVSQKGNFINKIVKH
jgi:hypothetical protein